MTGFIEKPNLPKGKVSSVIIGESCNTLEEYLKSREIEILKIEPNLHVDPAVKFHADMAAVYLGDNKILLDKKQGVLGRFLAEKNFEVFFTEDDVAGEYPSDIKLNFTLFGDYIMGKLSHADEMLLSLTRNCRKIGVAQGYCKCSCLVVDENSLITDDKSIYDSAVKNGIDTLLISKDNIILPGHKYGFIGGASGKISKHEVLFFGDVTKHRDYKKIADFIKERGCELISLDFPLTDFGGMIPITEKTP